GTCHAGGRLVSTVLSGSRASLVELCGAVAALCLGCDCYGVGACIANAGGGEIALPVELVQSITAAGEEGFDEIEIVFFGGFVAAEGLEINSRPAASKGFFRSSEYLELHAFDIDFHEIEPLDPVHFRVGVEGDDAG